MNRPRLNKPNPAIERLYLEAEDAWGRLDYQKSISLLKRASRKDPSNPFLLLDVARACGQRYDYVAAKRYLEKAVQISLARAPILEEAGKVCFEFDELDMAMAYFRRSCQQKDVSIGVLITLADMYIRDRRLDEAAELIARAAQMNQKEPRVLLEQAVLKRARGEIHEAESRYRELLKNTGCTVPVRIRASYGLGDILDGAGQYDEAMTVLLEAKAIQRTGAGPYAAELEHIQNRGKEMEQTITASVMDRWRAVAEKLRPPRRIALVCGHPRSGTTLLEQVLDAHSDVISSEETKIMHDEAYLPLIRDFPEGTSILEALDLPPLSVICNARDNYFRCTELLLRRQIGGRLLLDKNPALNLMIPMVVRIFPETKYLVALRDPRDVIVSCFMQALPMTPISSAYLNFGSAVKQYASVMGFWLEMLPRMGNQWMYVRYEEMVEDLPGTARSVLEFLGLGYEAEVLSFYEHARAKRVKSPSHADVRKPLYRTAVGRWRNYEKYLEPYIARLQPLLRAFNYR